MFDLSKNPDFKTNNTKVLSQFADISSECNSIIEIYSFEAIDQWIEHILCTIPGERLFNLNLGSPLYKILFDNSNSDNLSQVFNQIIQVIEKWIPDITIDNDSSRYNFDETKHTLTIEIVYYSKKLASSHKFSRRIKK